ncbi:MAG: decarboxylating 6-phosphogluconate dehydrogenase [Acidobacteria bacterium]|nr:decarboxylating 6-phosphogluconate dehydrogenase [Acidobacteriota bacterium]
MQLGMIGLGRMGGSMIRRIMAAGHTGVVHDRDTARMEEIVAAGAVGAISLVEMAAALAPPRAVWVMLPAGDPTEHTVLALADTLSAGDIIIDGGNSHYKDDVRRARRLRARGIHLVDVGTSGGVWGFSRGYCLMIGGAHEAVTHLEPIFAALAPGRGDIAPTPERDGHGGTAEHGYLYCGPPGAGHFVKMVHNGIEYGLMQAYAEGFDILRQADAGQRPEDERYRFNLADIAEVWRRGSVVGSWLLDLTAMALAEDGELAGYTGFVQDSGEGRWTIETAIEQAVPADVLAAALFARFRSRQDHTFADKVLSAMRAKFGGHVEPSTP